jgi:hypothetical protein
MNSSGKVDMGLYNLIARGSGAVDGLPPPMSLPGAPPGAPPGANGLVDIQCPRNSHRVDMNLYESVTGIRHKKTVNTQKIRATLLEAKELLINLEWTDDESIKMLGPSLADAIAMIVGKIK